MSLNDTQVFSFLEQFMERQVPYLSFSGGEPTLHPKFFEMVQYVCTRNAQLKIETNGHGMSREKAELLKRLGVKAVQVQPRWRSRETFNRMRVRGDFDQAIEGIRNLHAAGCRSKSTTRRRCSMCTRSVRPSTWRTSWCLQFLYGRTMYTGNAVKTWHRLARRRLSTRRSSRCCTKKSSEYRGRMRVYFHEMACWRNCATGCSNPPRC